MAASRRCPRLTLVTFNQAQELCSALGYTGLRVVPSRGESSFLLSDLESFLASQLANGFDFHPSSIAWLYLRQFGAGYKLWPDAGDGLLTFPSDDKMYGRFSKASGVQLANYL